MENQQTTATTETDAPEFTGRATYSPEDNKLRLYIGRVPRDEFLKLRAEGWTTLHKQREAGGGDFVAVWTPGRRDTALSYAGIIEDEDMGPEERAADRAERFGGYRDKRADEAGTTADRFDAGPAAHGFQSHARAERAARRHDRIAGRAVDAWDKAEYWQRRTAGVISHRLHLSSPGVRMGRIKDLESEIRKCEKTRADYFDKFALWVACSEMPVGEEQNRRALALAYVEHGDYTHPRSGRKSYLYDHGRKEEGRTDDPLNGAELSALWLADNSKPRAEEGDWLTHYRLRLAYENQMIEAQGGRAGVLEMVPGGWIRGGRRLGNEERQIVKVNKSHTTGRVVSVLVRDNHASTHNHWGNPFPDGVAKVLAHTVEVERMDPDAYRPPTADELATFDAAQKAAKKVHAATKPAPIPLINPTDADADRLQTIWNAKFATESSDRSPREVLRCTQAQYSANSGFRTETIEITGGGFRLRHSGHMDRPDCPVVAKVRACGGRVVILTDKPQKSFAANVWHDPRPSIVAELAAEFDQLDAAVRASYHDRTKEQTAIFYKARIVGLTYCDSTSQHGYTKAGDAWAKQQRGKAAPAPTEATQTALALA